MHNSPQLCLILLRTGYNEITKSKVTKGSINRKHTLPPPDFLNPCTSKNNMENLNISTLMVPLTQAESEWKNVGTGGAS
jgi:hypothetical protein